MGKKPFIFGDEMCGDEVFWGRSVPGTKCSGDEVCRGRSVPGTKCSGDEVCRGRNAPGDEVCPGMKCAWGQSVPGTKCSRGRSVPGDEMGVSHIASMMATAIPPRPYGLHDGSNCLFHGLCIQHLLSIFIHRRLYQSSMQCGFHLMTQACPHVADSHRRKPLNNVHTTISNTFLSGF